MSFVKNLTLFSIVLIPFEKPDAFLDLKYSKLKPNKVKLEKTVELEVDRSASPLFYKLEKVEKFQRVKVRGQVKIEKPLSSEEKDSYFQLGVIYKGFYRPNYLVRLVLPEWLLKILNINKKYGLGDVDFFHVTNSGYSLNKQDKVRSITLNFKTAGKLKENSEFEFEVPLQDKEILGLWLRADGDDHDGVFFTQINYLELIK